MAVELVLLSGVSYRGREVAGRRMRGLLAMLADDLRTGCSTARLVDGLWSREQPANPTKALQVLVSRARALLGAGVIASTPTGYRLALAEDQVDSSAILLRAAASARQLRAGDDAAALAQAQAGLALWDGTVPDDAALDDPVATLRAGRSPAYRSLVRVRALALARLGRHGEAVGPLAALAANVPRDEEVLLELLCAEAATAGSAAALERYEAYRKSLRDELGIDPGPKLREAYQRLLRGDPRTTVRHGVAYEPNPLLGREEDLAAVAALVRRSRVTTIVGPGGLGKTRMANAVARDAKQRRVYFVPLAGVATDDDVAGQVASAVGAGEHVPSRWMVPSDALTAVAVALGGGPALLVLDNCEHVVGGVADLVAALVSAMPELRVLATSRTPLGLSSESVYALPELSLPAMVELFGQRARAARPGVELPAEAVERLCQRLDGLPLAVELAAARVRAMSVPEIAAALADRFGLLRGGPRDAPERHRTLWAVVDWSWYLLDPAGQEAMRTLAVFPDGFTVDAARHLLGGADVLRTLEHLVDQSLLKVADTGIGARFRMLETVREFSAAQRDAAGEDDRVTAGFLAWAREFGRAHDGAVFGPDPLPATGRMRAERENLRQALHQAVAGGDAATVAAATAVLATLWMLESDYARMGGLAQVACPVLSHYRPTPEFVDVTRTAATFCAAYTLTVEAPSATRWLVTLRRLPPAEPDTVIRAAATVLAAVPEVLDPHSPRLREWCGSDEPSLAGVANGLASYVWEYEGQPGHALAAAERMLAAFRESGPWARLVADARLGDLHLQAGRGAAALPHLAAAAQMLADAGVRHETLGVRLSMVLATLQIGDVDAAERQLALIEPDHPEEPLEVRSFKLTVRAEILLARGEIDAGLRARRHVADLLRDAVERGDVLGLDGWTLEVESATVIAHARHGRLDLVAPLVAALPDRLAALLATLAGKRTYLTGFPVCGAALLALATVDIARGQARSGTRLTALAERFHFLRGLSPTMSPDCVERAAKQADQAAYAEARSTYAALTRDQLPAAAAAALRERAHA